MSALATFDAAVDPRTKTEAAINTKIELVTEAIEALVLATVVNLTADKNRSSHITDAEVTRALQITDARHAVADSLRTLLQPTLRITA